VMPPSRPGADAESLPTQPVQESELSFLRLADVVARVGLQKSIIYRMISCHEFPQPIKLGRTSVWSSEEITAWMRDRIDMARGRPARPIAHDGLTGCKAPFKDDLGRQ